MATSKRQFVSKLKTSKIIDFYSNQSSIHKNCLLYGKQYILISRDTDKTNRRMVFKNHLARHL